MARLIKQIVVGKKHAVNIGSPPPTRWSGVREPFAEGDKIEEDRKRGIGRVKSAEL